MGLLTDEARAWANEPFAPYEVTISATDIARYARAIGETDPIFYDAEAARAAGHRNVVAPPYFPYTIRMQAANLRDRSDLEPDGSSSEDVPPVETTRAMAGETKIEMGVPIAAGDTITLEKRIVDLYEKSGRSGDLVFVVQEFRFTNQDGALVMREEFTRIYR
ncbi:MAG: MaoC family dehydratase N-terminal domain-containing protein [Acidimicrobiia bacterium]|nr:MaoC family dehydratase N-terminal domain-containing protein [Acidimicrobiia bacterium]